MEKSSGHHCNQVVKLGSASSGLMWHCMLLVWLSGRYTMSFMWRSYWKCLTWISLQGNRQFYNVQHDEGQLTWLLQRIWCHEEEGESGTVLDCRRLRRHNSQMLWVNLEWILDWKNGIHKGHFGDSRRNFSIYCMLDIEFMVNFFRCANVVVK